MKIKLSHIKSKWEQVLIKVNEYFNYLSNYCQSTINYSNSAGLITNTKLEL